MIKQEISKLGNIDVERPVAANIVRKAVFRFRANALMTDPKIKRFVGGNGSSTDRSPEYVRIIRESEEKYSVSINVVIRFGISISRVANDIILEIRKDLKELIDFEPSVVIVNVVGVKPRSKPVIKRNIIIKG